MRNPINPNKNQKNVGFKIPCKCGKLYIKETSRALDITLKKGTFKNQKFVNMPGTRDTN